MLFFILGALFAAGLNIYSIENHYHMLITAPDGVAWSLWVPRPEIPFNLEIKGTLYSIAQVDTVHGLMDNVTGEGTVKISGTLNRRGIGFIDYDDVYLEAHINFSGMESWDRCWVWRWSSDPQANISFWTDAGYNADSSSGWQVGGGGHAYSGEVSAGWSQVGVWGVGSGNALLGDYHRVYAWICVALGVVCTFVALYKAYKTRRQRKKEQIPADSSDK